MRYTLALALVCLSGCESGHQGAAVDRGLAAALWAYSLHGEAVVVPVDPKPGEKCPDCNGTGKVGDGTVMKTCKRCDGTGVIGMPVPETPAPAPPKKEPVTLEPAKEQAVDSEGSYSRSRFILPRFRR